MAKDFQRFLPLLRMTTEEFERLGGATGVLSDTTVSNLDAMNVKLRQFQNTASTALASVAGAFLDLGADIKESPLQASFDLLTGDYDKIEKRIIEREKKLKEVILKERSDRAGQQKEVVDQAELDRQGANEAKLDEKIRDAEGSARKKVIDMLADSEADRRKQDLADFKQAEKEKRDLLQMRAEMIPDIEQLQAERAGPAAEMALLEKRAREAGIEARKTGTVEDVKTAEEAALRFQRAQEQDLRNRRLGDVAEQRARDIANQVVGALPMAQQLGQQLRDIPSSTEAQRTQPVKLENPPDLKGIMDKLDTLIKNAGVFS
jgi:hypothetical protein